MTTDTESMAVAVPTEDNPWDFQIVRVPVAELALSDDGRMATFQIDGVTHRCHRERDSFGWWTSWRVDHTHRSQKMTVTIRNGYEIKDILKNNGAKWLPEEKAWRMDAATWQMLVDTYGRGINKRDRARADAFATVEVTWN